MISEERKLLILNKLHNEGYIQATDIAEELGISAATIRRDLILLEKEGLCIRKRGGAIKVHQGVTLELPYEIKSQHNIDAKNRISEKAAELVQDGDTLILDAGSTTYALAARLAEKKGLTVVTNDLKIAVKLASNPNINLICTGGVSRANVYTLQGSYVEEFLKDLHVDKTFLGADAIHEDGIVSNVNIEEVPIKKAMINAGKKVILLADSSKFLVNGFSKVCDLSQLDLLITNTDIQRKAIELLQRKEIKYELV